MWRSFAFPQGEILFPLNAKRHFNQPSLAQASA